MEEVPPRLNRLHLLLQGGEVAVGFGVQFSPLAFFERAIDCANGYPRRLRDLALAFAFGGETALNLYPIRRRPSSRVGCRGAAAQGWPW